MIESPQSLPLILKDFLNRSKEGRFILVLYIRDLDDEKYRTDRNKKFNALRKTRIPNPWEWLEERYKNYDEVQFPQLFQQLRAELIADRHADFGQFGGNSSLPCLKLFKHYLIPFNSQEMLFIRKLFLDSRNFLT